MLDLKQIREAVSKVDKLSSEQRIVKIFIPLMECEVGDIVEPRTLDYGFKPWKVTRIEGDMYTIELLGSGETKSVPSNIMVARYYTQTIRLARDLVKNVCNSVAFVEGNRHWFVVLGAKEDEEGDILLSTYISAPESKIGDHLTVARDEQIVTLEVRKG